MKVFAGWFVGGGDVTPRPPWPVGGDLACKYSRSSAPEGPLEHETAFVAAGESVEANWVTAELSQCYKTVAEGSSGERKDSGDAGGRGSCSEVTGSGSSRHSLQVGHDNVPPILHGNKPVVPGGTEGQSQGMR